MPDNREVRQPGQSTNQAQQQAESARQIQEQLVEEIRAAANNELEERRLAKTISDAVKDAEVSAGEQRRSTHLQAQGASPIMGQNERQAVSRSVVRALKAVEQGILTAPSESNKAVLLKLNDKVGTQITETNAAFLQPIIAKLLESNQTVQNLQVEYEAIKRDWGVFGPELVKKVSDAIIETASEGKLAVNEEQAHEMFKVEDIPQQAQEDQRQADQRQEQESKSVFAGIVSREYTDAFQTYFGNDESDIRVIKAIHNLDEMKSFISERKGIVQSTYSNRGQPLDDIKLWQLVSEDVEREIVLRFTKLFMQVDEHRPTEPWEKVSTQGGMWDNPQVVLSAMQKALQELGRKTQRMSDAQRAEEFGSMQFFRRVSHEKGDEFQVEFDEVKDKNGKILQEGGKKTIRKHNINPLTKLQSVGIGDYFSDIHTMVEHEVQAREYLHNIKLAFLNPAGEGGFWGGLSRFAEQLRSTDIDSMMFLPDSHLFLTSYRLYTKFLEEELALLDWRHRPNLFAPDLFNNDTKLEQRVKAALKKLFPLEVGNDQKDEWRIRRAMSMGIGLAKGVLLTEVELAAYAEPGQDENGKPLLTSQYTNDGVALATLNPQHHFLRWQSESALKGTLVFMPLIGMFGKPDSKFMRGHWDHRVLMEMAQKHHKSYMSGKGVYGDRPDGEKLFIDFLPGFAKAGGYFTRGGWRFKEALSGSIRYDRQENGTQTINPLRTWKAIENIGYEALKALTDNGDFMKLYKDPKSGLELRKYMFEKYISRGGKAGMDLESYMSILKNKYKGEEVEKIFMQQTLTHVLHKRIPTKLIKLERDRFAKGGNRAFTLVRESMGLTGDEMNELMENLMIVEAKVRDETSVKMVKAGKEDLADVEIDDYEINAERIRAVLGNANLDSVQIESTIKLFEKIEEFTFKGNVGDRYVDGFAYKLHKGEFPFSIAAEEVDFTFLPLRAAGERVLARVLGDNGKIEKAVFENMTKYIDILQPVSIGKERDVGKFIELLHHMHNELDQIHGHKVANQVVYAMASLTIAYFKRDTLAENWWTKLGSVGRKTSMAAEFAGSAATRGVWEWGTEEVNNFIVALEKNNLLRPKSTNLAEWDKGSVETKKLLGFINYKKRTGKKEDLEHADVLNSTNLRKHLGGSYKDIVKKIFLRYVPAIAIGILYSYMSKAIKETSDKKK